MAALSAFCNQLVAFFEDLSLTYPEEKDLGVALQALKLMKQANPRMVHTVFSKAINGDFEKHILDENEDEVIGMAKNLLDAEYSDISFAFWIFDKHWKNMSETNKQHIWKYLKSLVLLSRRARA